MNSSVGRIWTAASASASSSGPGKEQREARAAGGGSVGAGRGEGEAVDEEDQPHESDVGRALRLPRQDGERKGGGGQGDRSAARSALQAIDGQQDQRKPQTRVEVRSRLERGRPAAEAEDHAAHRRGDRRGPEPSREQGRKKAREGRPHEEGKGPGHGSRQQAIEKVRRIEERRLRISGERGAEEKERVPEWKRARGECPVGVRLPGIQLRDEIADLGQRRRIPMLHDGFPWRKLRHQARRQRHPSEKDGPVDGQREPSEEEQAPSHERSGRILHASSAVHPLARA